MILSMEEIRLTGWYGKYTIIYKVLYIPGGAEFLPSTVWIYLYWIYYRYAFLGDHGMVDVVFKEMGSSGW